MPLLYSLYYVYRLTDHADYVTDFAILTRDTTVSSSAGTVTSEGHNSDPIDYTTTLMTSSTDGSIFKTVISK